MNRYGDFIETFTGRRFWPLDPRPEEVDIKDIAHALSMLCRFTGHVKEFYSVAQHCVYVCDFLPPEFRLWGLLHDASEAYIGDLNKPTKRFMPEYSYAEDKLMAAIASRFGLTWPEPTAVKDVDLILLVTEARDFLHGTGRWGVGMPSPLPGKLHALPPRETEQIFLQRFHQLTDNNT